MSFYFFHSLLNHHLKTALVCQSSCWEVGKVDSFSPLLLHIFLKKHRINSGPTLLRKMCYLKLATSPLQASVYSVTGAFSFFFKYNIYLFLTVLSLHCCAGFSLIARRRGYSPVAVRKLVITDFYCRARALGHMGFSSCSSQVLEHVGPASLLHVGYSWTRDQTLSSALLSGFFVTEPPGKS